MISFWQIDIWNRRFQPTHRNNTQVKQIFKDPCCGLRFGTCPTPQLAIVTGLHTYLLILQQIRCHNDGKHQIWVSDGKLTTNILPEEAGEGQGGRG